MINFDYEISPKFSWFFGVILFIECLKYVKSGAQEIGLVGGGLIEF